jgi:ParB family chromosome partitioning protein
VTIAAKPQLVQISTAYGQPQEGDKTIPRNKYVEIRAERPETKEKAKWPEYKTCKYTTQAIVTNGSEKGEIRKVCANPDCQIHHPRKQQTRADTSFKAEQEKHRREEALANATGLRVLNSIVAAVPVRLMKRDLLFVVESLFPLLDERRLSTIARNRGIRPKEGEALRKLLSAWLRKAEESELGRLLVEAAILLSARSGADAGKVLRAAAEAYKVDTAAVALKVKQEFAAKEKARKTAKPDTKATPKPKRAA